MEDSQSFRSAAKFAQTMSNITEHMGPLQNINNAHRELQEKIRPLRLHEIFTAGDSIRAIFKMNELGGLNILSQSISSQLSAVFPPGTVNAIQAISRQHSDFFNSIRGVTSILESHPVFSQLNSMHAAMNGISGRIAEIAASGRNWELLDEFEDISEQAITLTENLSANVAISIEEQAAFDKLIDFVVGFIRKNRRFGIYSLLFIDMVLRVASFHQYYDFLKSKPELATKEDLSQFQFKLIKSVEEKLKAEKEYRVISRKCKVFLKPRAQSLRVNILPANFEVVVLQTSHKWVYATYFDPIDHVPQSGWILKKYLAKP